MLQQKGWYSHQGSVRSDGRNQGGQILGHFETEERVDQNQVIGFLRGGQKIIQSSALAHGLGPLHEFQCLEQGTHDHQFVVNSRPQGGMSSWKPGWPGMYEKGTIM